MIDWTGPAYDPNNPRSLNAFLLPPSTYSSLLTCPVDLQSPETPVAGTIPQGVYTGTQLTAALQTIVRVSVPSATLTWSEGSKWFYLQSGDGFRIRFVGSQGFNRHLGVSSMQRNQYVDLRVPTNVRQAYRDDLIPGFFSGPQFATQLQDVIRAFVPTATVSFSDGTLDIDSGEPSTWLYVPSADTLRDASWKRTSWDAAGGPGYGTLHPKSVNSALNAPNEYLKVTETGLLNLQTCREVYIHSNLTSYSSLAPNGDRDVIARIPITSSYGDLEAYRPFSTLDSESVRLSSGVLTNIRMRVTDAYGALVPLAHFLTCELAFLDTPM